MDDLGYGDIGSYGAPDAKTPNIDRLAREGVKLTDFYANHANCSPTRTGFITGRYQQRYGIESPLRAIDDARQLLPSDTSLPRLLKSAGYATGLIGKWHLGARAEAGPNRHGFDEFWGFRGGAVDYYTHNAVTTPGVKLPAPIHDLYHNEEPTKVTGYLTDEITARSEAFIQQHSAAPFFLEVAYNATHWPFQGPDLPEAKRGWTNSIESGTRADYIAMLERADQGIGRILGLLDRLKLAAEHAGDIHERQRWRVALAQCPAVPSQIHVVGRRHSCSAADAVARASQAGHHLVSGRHHDGSDRVDSGGRGGHTAGKLSSGGH